MTPAAVADPTRDTFPIRITGTTTYAGVTAYTGVERALQGDWTWGDRAGGRFLTTGNPGIPIGSATFTADTTDGVDPPLNSLAIARPGASAGGLIFELTPIGYNGSGSFVTLTLVTNVCPVFGAVVVSGSGS